MQELCASQLIQSNLWHDQKYSIFAIESINQELKKMAVFPTDDLEDGSILHAIDRATKDLGYNKIAN